MTPTKAAEDVLVERLRRYSEYVERQLGALTPPDAIDLRVGPRMCVDAMIEAADAITTLLERERRKDECLCFFASVIKSGESWTKTCEEQFRAALTREGG